MARTVGDLALLLETMVSYFDLKKGSVGNAGASG